MTNTTQEATQRSARRLNGLRANCLAVVVMLVLELGLGVGVNLYAKIPSADSGTSLLPAFDKAVTDGPIVLTLHAILGTLLLVTGISVVVRTSIVRYNALLALASIALLAIIGAWQSGARFVSNETTATSMAMTIATGVSLLCYVLILFIVPSAATTKDAP